MIPGVYGAVTVRLVEAAGFAAAYLTGAGVSLFATAVPVLGVTSLGDVCARLERVTAATSLPIVGDADIGYGGVLSVIRTVREFERRGAAAIQLEDQVFPKRCGHEPGRPCVALAEMVGRLHAALDSRSTQDLLIVARTDALGATRDVLDDLAGHGEVWELFERGGWLALEARYLSPGAD